MAGDFVQLGDLRTWWDRQGEGEPLVVLHPGGFDSRALETNLPGLAEHFSVYRQDRRGHGRTADVDGPITYEQMARDTLAFVETVIGEPAHLFGHSDGAVVALLAAWLRPDLVRRLVFSSGVFHQSGWRPGVLDVPPDVLEFMAGWHAEVSPDGPGHFPEWAAKLERMHAQEPTLTPADLETIPTETLLMFGDDDEIEPEHLHTLHRSLPDAQLAIVPGTGHGVVVDKPELCNRMIVEFLTEQRTTEG